jgi:hypothetical protein
MVTRNTDLAPSRRGHKFAGTRDPKPETGNWKLETHQSCLPTCQSAR